MKLIELDMNHFQTEEEVHRLLAEELSFPEYYGANLDALYDMLTTVLEGNVCIVLIDPAPEAPLAEFAGRLRRVFADAAETIEEADDRMYAVFADKGPLNNDFEKRW